MTEFVVEVQLMRDMKPRSRPSYGTLFVGEPRPSQLLLLPGAAATGMETILVTIEGATRVQPSWCALRATFTIDGTGFLEPRPGYLYLGGMDVYSMVIHFPVLGNPGTHFGGLHTLLGRIPPENESRR